MLWMSLQPFKATSMTFSRWSMWKRWDISSKTISPDLGKAATVNSGPPVEFSRELTSTWTTKIPASTFFGNFTQVRKSSDYFHLSNCQEKLKLVFKGFVKTIQRTNPKNKHKYMVWMATPLGRRLKFWQVDLGFNKLNILPYPNTFFVIKLSCCI